MFDADLVLCCCNYSDTVMSRLVELYNTPNATTAQLRFLIFWFMSRWHRWWNSTSWWFVLMTVAKHVCTVTDNNEETDIRLAEVHSRIGVTVDIWRTRYVHYPMHLFFVQNCSCRIFMWIKAYVVLRFFFCRRKPNAAADFAASSGQTYFTLYWVLYKTHSHVRNVCSKIQYWITVDDSHR